MKQQYFFDTDGDCHWYMIPKDLEDEWREVKQMNPDSEETWKAFEKFDGYRTGGGINDIYFTLPIRHHEVPREGWIIKLLSEMPKLKDLYPVNALVHNFIYLMANNYGELPPEGIQQLILRVVELEKQVTSLLRKGFQ